MYALYIHYLLYLSSHGGWVYACPFYGVARWDPLLFLTEHTDRNRRSFSTLGADEKSRGENEREERDNLLSTIVSCPLHVTLQPFLSKPPTQATFVHPFSPSPFVTFNLQQQHLCCGHRVFFLRKIPRRSPSPSYLDIYVQNAPIPFLFFPLTLFLGTTRSHPLVCLLSPSLSLSKDLQGAVRGPRLRQVATAAAQ